MFKSQNANMSGYSLMLMWTCSSVKENHRISNAEKASAQARTFKHICNSVVKNQVPDANDKKEKGKKKSLET